jgi:hypothetical protein
VKKSQYIVGIRGAGVVGVGYWGGVYRYWGYEKGYLVKIGVSFYWKDVMGGGLNKNSFGGIYQYLVKLGVFFNIPRTQVLCHRFIE